MFYVVETNKSFEDAVAALEAEVPNHKFGVQHIHNIANTLRTKGVDFKEECKVFEICNPIYANRIMSIDMVLNTALPCRVSVYTESGVVKIGMIKPSEMFATLTDKSEAVTITKEVDEIIIKMIDNIK